MDADLRRPWLTRSARAALLLAAMLASVATAEVASAQGQEAALLTALARAAPAAMGEAIAFGTPGDALVPGDYDGDGKTDVAVWRPSTGGWWVYGIEAPVWGTHGDVPVPGDYDGDGKDDIAVYRRSNSSWYLLESSQVAASPAGSAAAGAASSNRGYVRGTLIVLAAVAAALLVGAALEWLRRRWRQAQAALAAREAALEGREAKVSRTIEELTKREGRVKLHERVVQHLETAVDTRAGHLNAEADRLERLRNDLALAASAPERREAELVARAAALEERQGVLVERGAELAEQRVDFEAQNAALAARTDAFEARIAWLHGLRHQPSDGVRGLVSRLAAGRRNGPSPPPTVAAAKARRLVRRAAELALRR